jgi:hypothetical protein
MSDEEPPVRRTLPARANRGSMMASLIANTEPVVSTTKPTIVEENDAAYEDFWKSNVLNSDSDEEFEEEIDDDAEQKDYMIDDESDNDIPPEKDENEETELNEKELVRQEKQTKRKQKKNIYVDKVKTAKAKSTTTTAGTRKRTRKAFEATPSDSTDAATTEKKDEKMSTRESTKQRTKLIREKEELRKLEPRKTKKRVYKEPTQQERLEQAKITAVYNRESLQYLLNREESQKKKVTVLKQGNKQWLDPEFSVIPHLTFYSKDGHNTIVFHNVDTVIEHDPEGSKREQNRIQKRKESGLDSNVCVITGEKAKYKEPKFGLPYANLAAYKIIKEHLVNFEKLREDPNNQYMDFIVHLSKTGAAKYLSEKYVEQKKKEQSLAHAQLQQQQKQQAQQFVQINNNPTTVTTPTPTATVQPVPVVVKPANIIKPTTPTATPRVAVHQQQHQLQQAAQQIPTRVINYTPLQNGSGILNNAISPTAQHTALNSPRQPVAFSTFQQATPQQHHTPIMFNPPMNPSMNPLAFQYSFPGTANTPHQAVFSQPPLQRSMPTNNNVNMSQMVSGIPPNMTNMGHMTAPNTAMQMGLGVNTIGTNVMNIGRPMFSQQPPPMQQTQPMMQAMPMTQFALYQQPPMQNANFPNQQQQQQQQILSPQHYQQQPPWNLNPQ